ncbi:MAG: pyrroline-5-carboxylate reductase [Candidatus Omnitrophica bacterium]|nr:pyrroline-5-carboxylate reductase [Candidatus Omnitrophota bacterium]
MRSQMKFRETLGLMGVGNMGQAILEGLFSKRMVTGSRVWVFDTILQKAAEFSKKWQCRQAKSNAEIVKQTDIVILAMKPQDFSSAMKGLKSVFRNRQTVISILAGTSVEKIRREIGPRPQVIRAMPNLGVKVGEGITAIATTGVKTLSLQAARKIFSGCGKTVELEESYLDLVTALSGSGPAYFFLVMELMVKEGVRQGIPEGQSRLLAVQTALGAATLAASSSQSPEALRQMVTSKGGTTAAALAVLEEGKFSDVFHRALEAAVERSRELSKRQPPA